MERGVYRAGYRSPGGHEVLIAVDHQGRKLARAVVPEDSDRFEVVETMRDLLNQTDPPLRAL